MGILTKNGEYYASYRAQTNDFHLAGSTNNEIGSSYTRNGFIGTWGITTDPTKSDIVTNLNGINIGEVNSMKLGKYILKY